MSQATLTVLACSLVLPGSIALTVITVSAVLNRANQWPVGQGSGQL